jgi:hypothetical protein
MFLLYYILSEVKEMSSHGTVDSMFLLFDKRREVREMSSHGTVDSMFPYYQQFHDCSSL